ncbi:MAG: leucine-rich repeat domain-containing protein, partial [Muribaculaceae bacterium]|nr:leucine-rich repeat domain-containing protein [Muribaculaceae bacterium]
YIGDDAFLNRNMSKVILTDLRAWCDIDFTNTDSNPAGWAFDGVWIGEEKLIDLVIPAGVTEIKPYAFQCPPQFDEEASSSSKKIYNGWFRSVLIPETVTSIGEEAFFMNGFSELTIPSSVQYIGHRAFSGLNSVLELDNRNNYSFKVQPLKQLTLQDFNSQIMIEEDAFTSTSTYNKEIYTDYNAPEKFYQGRILETLPQGFQSKVYSLVIGDQVTEIGSSLWKNSSLSNVRIGNAVENIGNEAFKNCEKLKTLELGSSLKTIGDEAFKGYTGLEEIVVPPSVETIGASAFADNRQLSSIIMGYRVTTIGEKAFDGCPASTVSITAQTPPTAPNNTFSNYSGKLYLQGQEAADAYYDAFTCWDRFNGLVMIEASGIEADTKPISGKAGDTFQLTATLIPQNVTLP